MPVRDSARRATRLASAAALVLVAGLCAYLVLAPRGAYTIHVRFVDAGQLLSGNLVEVGGVPVGSISDIRLTADNQADVVMHITDGRFTPLHRGTTATIRLVGLSSVANRYVALTPGPLSAPALASGATLDTTATNAIVDLDQVLDSLDARTRGRIQRLLGAGAQTLAGVTAPANRTLNYLNPAVDQTAALTGELDRDEPALSRLVASASSVAATLSSNTPALAHGVDSAASALTAVAGQRAALADSLSRAPAVLAGAQGTLGRLRDALGQVRPALVAARPAAAPLAALLPVAVSAGRAAEPVVTRLQGELPALAKTLRGLPPLAAVGVPALDATTSTLQAALPIVDGLRPYVPDMIAGLFNGFGGNAGGYYDANGHYARVSVTGGQGTNGGVASLLPAPPSGSVSGVRTGVLARCPGGAAEPTGDRSNPWIADASNCNPKDNHP
jgi:phospholipid/cholesterol/gamma-HCH transport system substrate-binding protein